MDTFEIINNKDQEQFEIKIDGSLSMLVYRIHKNKLFLMHTEVPPSLGGKGIASALATYAFQFAKENNLPVVVYCPFVKVWLKRHPELNDQLDKSPDV